MFSFSRELAPAMNTCRRAETADREGWQARAVAARTIHCGCAQSLDEQSTAAVVRNRSTVTANELSVTIPACVRVVSCRRESRGSTAVQIARLLPVLSSTSHVWPSGAC